ncbi:MinD/ParA family ATP-binding protein [Nocardioides sp. GXZ039]|uniref:MinD/ParA family ATP-binding protein n=1 Tax=Nocardioides sp. GXZ039 TaxID=3136018 RepID=UPI0030F3E468
MSVIAVASAKGAPGASITAAALAALWPRPAAVLVDLDPAGGDVAWRARDPHGQPLDPDRGLLSLAAAARRGAAETPLADHLQETAFGFPVLAGVPTPEQLAGIGGVWSVLPEILAAHGSTADVIADCGRVTLGSPVLPVLSAADAVLLVVRPDVEGIAHLRNLLRALRRPLRLDEPGAQRVGVVVATSYRDTATVTDLQHLLQHEQLPARVLGIVARDDKAARVLASSRSGRLGSSLLGRSARTLSAEISSHLTGPSQLQPGRS